MESLPIPADSAVARLAELGERLWVHALMTPVISRNGGRTSVALPPTMDTVLTDIDQVLLDAADASAAIDLAAWHALVQVVDPGDHRRRLRLLPRSE